MVARLVALPPRALAGLGAAILVLCGALWWLYRSGLERMALLSRAGKSSVPLEALRRSLPLFAAGGDLDCCRADGRRGRASRLAAGGRARAVAVGGLPAPPQRFAVRRRERARDHAPAAAFAGALGGPRGRRRRRSGSRDSKRSRAAVGGGPHRSGGFWRSAPDRRRNMVAARRTCSTPSETKSPRRGPVALSPPRRHVVPGLMVVAAVSGLAGWINFGWALARAVAFFVLAAGLALLLCSGPPRPRKRPGASLRRLRRQGRPGRHSR